MLDFIVNKLIFKLLCSYQQETSIKKEKEKKEEEKIEQCSLYRPLA